MDLPFNGGKSGFLFDHPQSLALILFLTQQGFFICGVIPPFLTQITRTITHRNKEKGQLAQRQRGVCCRFYYYYKFHQESLLTCGSNSGKAYFPSCGSSVPMPVPRRGGGRRPLPGAHAGLEGLLQGSPTLIPGIQGEEGKGEWEKDLLQGRTAVLRALALSSGPPGGAHVQILHLLRNQYATGVLFQTSQKTQWGGAAEAWATTQSPQTLGDKMEFNGRKSSGPRCLLTSKAHNSKAAVNHQP